MNKTLLLELIRTALTDYTEFAALQKDFIRLINPANVPKDLDEAMSSVMNNITIMDKMTEDDFKGLFVFFTLPLVGMLEVGDALEQTIKDIKTLN